MFGEIDIIDYLRCRAEEDILIDLRDRTTFGFGTIEGAVNIPIENIAELYCLPKEKKIYLFCQAGDISGEFAELLSDAGYEAYNLLGGYRKYLRNKIQKQR